MSTTTALGSNGEVNTVPVTTAAFPSSTALSALSKLNKTDLIFQSGAHQQTYKFDTQMTAILPLNSLPQEDQAVFKKSADSSTESTFATITESTIFHPQGGGQPSDVGHFFTSIGGKKIFNVWSTRTSVSQPGIVLHFGAFEDVFTPPTSIDFAPIPVTQVVNADKRLLYSRLHTAGHVLGTATRTLLENKIDNFDELKASHFPDSAACEFQGSIDGKYKPEIQSAVDELIDQDAEVRIEWWRKVDFRDRELERLLPSDDVWREIGVTVDGNGVEVKGEGGDEETRIRVVNIVGAEVYPCGGTHVPSTKGCGKVSVRKISRQKGNSRISYLVD